MRFVNKAVMRTSIGRIHCQGTNSRDGVHHSLIWCHFSVYADAKAPRLTQMKPSTPRHYAHHHLHPERVIQSVATRFGFDQTKLMTRHRVRLAEEARIQEIHIAFFSLFFLDLAIINTSLCLCPAPSPSPFPFLLVRMAVRTDPCGERFRSFVNA